MTKIKEETSWREQCIEAMKSSPEIDKFEEEVMKEMLEIEEAMRRG